MRELSIIELDSVSGGGLFGNLLCGLFGGNTAAPMTATSNVAVAHVASGPADSLLGAVAGAAIGANSGMIIGGIHGGDGGGILGIGAIGQAVGLIVPTIAGAINGAILGGIYGLSNSQPLINQLIQGTANGTIGQGGNAAAIRL